MFRRHRRKMEKGTDECVDAPGERIGKAVGRLRRMGQAIPGEIRHRGQGDNSRCHPEHAKAEEVTYHAQHNDYQRER